MTDMIQVTTTTETEADAQAIAGALVTARLAACVQVLGPITSTYRWQGQIEIAQEWLCLIKSEARLYPQVEQAILAAHPYETPEIIATPIISGSDAYLAWLSQSLTP